MIKYVYEKAIQLYEQVRCIIMLEVLYMRLKNALILLFSLN